MCPIHSLEVILLLRRRNPPLPRLSLPIHRRQQGAYPATRHQSPDDITHRRDLRIVQPREHEHAEVVVDMAQAGGYVLVLDVAAMGDGDGGEAARADVDEVAQGGEYLESGGEAKTAGGTTRHCLEW